MELITLYEYKTADGYKGSIVQLRQKREEIGTN